VEESKMYFNVLMKDGNRTVNWDFTGNSTVRQCLEKFRWQWKPNTVKVNGYLLKNDQLDRMLKHMADLTMQDYQNNDRIVITLIAPPEPKKTVKAGKKGGVRNVHQSVSGGRALHGVL